MSLSSAATSDVDWCPHRRLQSHAGAVADQRPAPPLGVPCHHLPDGHGLHPPGGQHKTSPHRAFVAELARQHRRNCDDPAPLSSFSPRDSQGPAGRHLRPRTRGQRLPLRRSRHLPHHRRQPPPAVQVSSARGRADRSGPTPSNSTTSWTSSRKSPRCACSTRRGTNLLTPREEQVVALVAEGLGNREIARELNLSEHTIKKYLYRIFEKLGISTRVELVLYAVNNGDPRHAEWLAGASRILPGA